MFKQNCHQYARIPPSIPGSTDQRSDYYDGEIDADGEIAEDTGYEHR